FIRFAVCPRHHANHLIALHFGPEATAHTAIRARSDDGVFGLPHLDDGVFLQRGGGACLYAGATGHTVAFQERHALPGLDARFKALAADGQRESSLDFFACANATAAYDALGGVVGEIGIRLVGLLGQVVGTLLPIAHVTQAHDACHI